MATYEQWNSAITEYFTKGLPYGAKVYLSVDDDALRRIGKKLKVEVEDPLEDFLTAIRSSCCRDNDIRFDHFRWRDENDNPEYVAFLVATVLAAYRMGETDDVTDTNYFRRLREVLGFPSDEGRPPGMRPGDEECFWLDWERWLRAQGYLSTASRGEGPTIYINYPISQALLRIADKRHIREFFLTRHYPSDLDILTFGALLLNDRRHIQWQHLKDVLKNNRFQAAAEACYEIYQLLEHETDNKNESRLGLESMRYSSDRLLAGLYRVEDPFSFAVSYHVYPRQQKRTENIPASILIAEKEYPLTPDRPGWYAPLEERISPEDIGKRFEFDLTGHPMASKLVLPERDFWVLVPDPDDEGSGVYADWSRPEPGVYFYLLCRKELSAQILFLKDEYLIEWEGEPQALSDKDEWVEYKNVLVRSPSWGGIMNNSELYSALCPLVRLGISLKGGIRYAGAWLASHPPAVTVNGYFKNVKIAIFNLSTEKIVWEENVKVNESLTNLPQLVAGQYLITAEYLTDTVQRLFKLIDWQEVDFDLNGKKYKTVIGDWTINGGEIEAMR